METTRHIVTQKFSQATMHVTTEVFTSIGDAIKPTCKDEIKTITLVLIERTRKP
jgi:hypothetical protein